RSSRQLGASASRLYWLNTAGAITGAWLAGFVLLAHVGVLRTLIAAVILNEAVAVTIVFFSKHGDSRAFEDDVDVAQKPVPIPTLSSSGLSLILLVSAISGMTSMMFEIGWTRILALFLSSTTHAFTAMLATFLFGITLGSYLFERWHAKWKISTDLLGQLL